VTGSGARSQEKPSGSDEIDVTTASENRLVFTTAMLRVALSPMRTPPKSSRAGLARATVGVSRSAASVSSTSRVSRGPVKRSVNPPSSAAPAVAGGV